MIRVFLRGLAAHFRAGRTLLVLGVLGVALGVASVLSIQILNGSALGAFEGGLRAVSGEADLTVLGKVPTVPDSWVREALSERGVEAAWPVVRTPVKLEGPGETFLDLVGVDFLAPVWFPWDVPAGEVAAALGEPGWAAVSERLARERGWKVGDVFGATSGSRRLALRVGLLVDFRKVSPLAGDRLVVLDIAQAQDALGLGGAVHQVDVKLAAGADRAEVAARLARRLGAAAQVLTPEQRRSQAAGLLSAFRLNLTALSLISLLVGAFLVHTTTQAALVRRRAEFGLLRSLGTTRRQVLAIVLAEVGLFGVLGTALGIPIGYWAAAANVEAVSETLSNLYLLEGIGSLRLEPSVLALAVAVGLGGAVAGAFLPALELSRRDTRTLLAPFSLHERVGKAARRLLAAGGAILAGTGLWYAVLGREWRPAGFVVALGLLIALPLMTPWLLRAVSGLVRARGFGLAYGVKALGVKLGTTSFAVAALGIAVTMLVGITIMVGSFRRTLEAWIDSTIRADVYVTTESWRRARETAVLDPAIVDALVALPGVRSADRLRRTRAHSGGRSIALVGRDVAMPGGEGRFPLIEGDRADAIRRVAAGEAAMIGEPLARKAGLRVGDRLPLTAPGGDFEIPIAGIYLDYAEEHGSAVLDLAALESRFGPAGLTNVDLYLEPGADPERVMDRIRERFPEAPLELLSNRRLREEILAIFDQTFAVTRLLQGMALLIAVAGITLTLLVLARERVSELALYRALGAGRRRILRVFLGEGVGMAGLGILLGIPGGAALALVLIRLVNRAYFGWTIVPSWPAATLAVQAAALLAAAAAASLYPAIRASRTPATELRRDDL